MLLDLKEDGLGEVDASFFLQEGAEVFVGDLVSIFKFTIVLAVLLHRVVSQVDIFVFNFFEIELLTGGSQVPFFVEISSKKPDLGLFICLRLEEVGKEAVYAKVKLPPVNQVRVRYVLLQDHSLILAQVLSIDGADDLSHIVKDLDAMTAVAVFSRLQDPDVVPAYLDELVELLILLVVLLLALTLNIDQICLRDIVKEVQASLSIVLLQYEIEP